MPFKPLNRFESVDNYKKKLPHWRQRGVTYFVTSRLADSLPSAIAERWQNDRHTWLREHRIASIEQLADLSDEIQQEYHRVFTARFHELLDAGHGSCLLRRPDLASVLVARLVANHQTDHDLDTWVVMPNHFHALVTPHAGMTLGRITQSWKGASAREINLRLNQTGRLWQPEGFDHIVRSEPQLQHFRRYIANNPGKAGLRDGYVLGVGNKQGLNAHEVLQRFGLEK